MDEKKLRVVSHSNRIRIDMVLIPFSFALFFSWLILEYMSNGRDQFNLAGYFSSPWTRETVDRGWTRHPLKSLPIELVVRPASCPFSDAPTGAVDYSTLFSNGAVMSDRWW